MNFLNRHIIYFIFLIISYNQLVNSHDFEQYILQAEQLENIRDFGALNVYVFFIDIIISVLENSFFFVYFLWILNWLSIYYFLIYLGENKFNFWFLLTYFLLFGYLWHTNQLRQGLVMPIFIYYFIKKIEGSISNTKYLSISSLLSTWHLASLSMFSIFIKIKLHYLIPFAIFFSYATGGENTLINFSSLSIFLMILISLKKKSKYLNIISFLFIIFLIFRPYSSVISSRMLELSLLVFPFLFLQKNSIYYKVIFTFLSVLISLNNFNFFE